MALTVGSRLGHYDVTALIGEGGMGQVYQATDTKLSENGAEIGRVGDSSGQTEPNGWAIQRSDLAASGTPASQNMPPFCPVY